MIDRSEYVFVAVFHHSIQDLIAILYIVIVQQFVLDIRAYILTVYLLKKRLNILYLSRRVLCVFEHCLLPIEAIASEIHKHIVFVPADWQRLVL